MSAGAAAGESVTDIYDALAPHYREYAQTRAAYLDAVDRFIVEHAAKGGSVLDVGAGDGVRGMGLALRLGAARVVLAEPSKEMAARCRQLGPAAVWETPAEALPQSDFKFDVVLCLWNVLGHLPGRPRRLAALAAMKRVLAPGGTVFLDVNNRHNARAYGRYKVLARRAIDFLSPDERRGDVAYEWRVGGASLPAMGHLFTPAEIEGIIVESGLEVTRRVAVDYATGGYSASPYRGQLLYQAGHGAGKT